MDVSGSVQHVISDDERVTFGVGDNELKQAVDSYFGRRPNDAYLHSPTPWGDLYKRFSWEQVETVVVAESAQILEITSQPEIVKSETFENSSSYAADFITSVSVTLCRKQRRVTGALETRCRFRSR